MLRSKKLLVLLAVVSAVGVGSFAAYAAIPGSDGVIHGCYDKLSGSLRVTDTQTGQPKSCSNKEVALGWNQQGPPGPKGDPGLKGEAGLAGPSDAYEVFGETWKTLAYGQFMVLQTITLEPGSYVLSGTVTARVTAGSGHTAGLACYYQPDGTGTVTWNNQPDAAVAKVHDPANLATMPVLGDVVVASTATVQLKCQSSGPDDVQAEGASLATKIGELHHP